MFKKLSLFMLLFLGLQLACANLALADSSCLANLTQKIEGIVNSAEFGRSRWGIVIQTLNTEQTLYAKEANSYFIPASNAKLLTTAGVLNQLGGNFRFRTGVYSTGDIPNLTSLRLVGAGDPTLTTEKLETLAKQLKALGVRRILELILEDTKAPVINPSWEWEDVYGYGGIAVNNLVLNQNTFSFTIFPQTPGKPLKLSWSDAIAMEQWQLNNQGITNIAGQPYSVEIGGDLGRPVLRVRGKLASDAPPDVWDLPILNPREYFLKIFRRVLSDQGITVLKAKVVTTKSSNKAKQLAVIESPLLPELLAETNQKSNNVFAQALVNALDNNLEKTLTIVEDNLTAMGIDNESYVLEDASGLSRKNLVSPQAFVDTLKVMAKHPDAKIYRDSLAIAGVSGTLKSRFNNTTVAGKLQGKSGFVTHVLSLSGYLEVPNYDTLVLSILLNQSTQKYPMASGAIDQMVLALMDLSKC